MILNRVSAEPVRVGRLTLVVAALLGCLSVPAHAGVTFLTQDRDVLAFGIIDLPTGEDPQCNDRQISEDPGVFDITATCDLTDPSGSAHGTASQLSYISDGLFMAEGNFSAMAETLGDADFAEGFGASSFLSQFTVDQPTQVHLIASLHAADAGRTGIVFRKANGAILLLHDLEGQTLDIDETFSLDAGIPYEINIVASGFGQATVFGDTRASGSYSASITFPVAAGIADLVPDASMSLRVWPNPVRYSARILVVESGSEIDRRSNCGGRATSTPESRPHGTGLDRTIEILDLNGRLVRSLAAVDVDAVNWDTRNADGNLVPAGIYWVRRGGAKPVRVAVLR